MWSDLKIWRQIGVRYRRKGRFLATWAGDAAFAVNNLGICQFHGMEEVVGSIPTRSTIFNRLHQRLPLFGLRSFEVKHLRAQDRLERIGADARPSLSPSEFSGTWVNTNTDTPGITHVTCTVEGDVLRVRLEGNGSSEPSGWGEA